MTDTVNHPSNKIVYGVIAVLCLMFWGSVLYIANTSLKRIDCSMAEFHPDFTPEMKKICRERRSHKL